MKHYKWPSIGQYREVVRNIERRARFAGVDERGEPIINIAADYPTLEFVGTVKLHGTNAAVVIGDGEHWFQSRERIITPEKDNAGFAVFATAKIACFINIAKEIRNKVAQYNGQDIAIYGEWCGGNIQNNVAINQLPKMFVIFGIDLIDKNEVRTHLGRDQAYKVSDNSELVNENIYSIHGFLEFNCIIDFNNPRAIQNNLNEITSAVELECPVAKKLGVNGVGEGVVWRCISPEYESADFWFKVKGEKHSKSKVKTLAVVDVERMDNIEKIVRRVAHNGRLEQMHQQVFDTLNGGQTNVGKLGAFIKAVMGDILKEEIDLLATNRVSGKEISGRVSKRCREFIMNQLNINT